MNKRDEDSARPEKIKSAVCGLFCPACSIYIGTKEDPERLQGIAELFGQPVEAMKCDGCRSDRRTGYCKTCEMISCADSKGIDFCGECNEYPCDKIKAFQAVLPHRLELWASQERIAKVGYEKWYAEMLDHYACPQCGALNSAYDAACRKCAATPSCKYVLLNRDDIATRLSDMPRVMEEFKRSLNLKLKALRAG